MKTSDDYIRNLAGRSLSAGVSRRSVLKSILALSIAPSVMAADLPRPISVQKLHHFGLRVADVARSLAFYQDIFGAPIQARRGETVCLRIGAGPAFFSLSPTVDGEAPGISHIGISVADFNSDRLTLQLEAHGIMRREIPAVNGEALESALRCWVGGLNVEQSGSADDLYFADVEGLVYQLCSASYCGGTECGLPEPVPGTGLVQLVDINHFTNYMSNSSRANQFYLNLFGLEFQAYQGPNSPIVGVGDGKQFLMYVGGAQEGVPLQPGRTDHVSLSVTDFDVDTILGKLTGYGLRARENSSSTPPLSHWVSMRMPNRGGAEGGTPEVYFSDPDGLHIQLQHVDYCGGGGYLGDVCA